MARRGLKPIIAVICPLAAAGAVYAAGAVNVKRAEETYRQKEQTMPQVQLEAVLKQIQDGEKGFSVPRRGAADADPLIGLRQDHVHGALHTKHLRIKTDM